MKTRVQEFSGGRQNVLMYLFSVYLITVASKIMIPISPVPITLQTVAILFIGLTSAIHISAASVATYLLLGAIGLPVFASSNAGFPVLVGPTGGYLIGFFAAAVCVAWLQHKRQAQTLLDYIMYSLAGMVIIYILGVAWLSHLIGLDSAIKSGLLPFIVSGAIKSVLLSGLLRITKSLKKE